MKGQILLMFLTVAHVCLAAPPQARRKVDSTMGPAPSPARRKVDVTTNPAPTRALRKVGVTSSPVPFQARGKVDRIVSPVPPQIRLKVDGTTSNARKRAEGRRLLFMIQRMVDDFHKILDQVADHPELILNKSTRYTRPLLRQAVEHFHLTADQLAMHLGLYVRDRTARRHGGPLTPEEFGRESDLHRRLLYMQLADHRRLAVQQLSARRIHQFFVNLLPAHE